MIKVALVIVDETEFKQRWKGQSMRSNKLNEEKKQEETNPNLALLKNPKLRIRTPHFWNNLPVQFSS